MFKFLKKKHKRSDWMEGLLAAENLIKDGYSCDSTKPSLHTLGSIKITILRYFLDFVCTIKGMKGF